MLVTILSFNIFFKIDFYLDAEFCPDKAGLDVGICLKALGPDKLSEACNSYITLHEQCSKDIEYVSLLF